MNMYYQWALSFDMLPGYEGLNSWYLENGKNVDFTIEGITTLMQS